MSVANAAAYAGPIADPYAEDPSFLSTITPIWRETWFGMDWLALHASPVYYGCGVPHGSGEPVVVIPGFLADDFSLTELHCWLRRIGYEPYFSNIGQNLDCPDHLSDELMLTIRRAHEETGQRVRLIGHSLGGMLARSVALNAPEYIDRVITMGSPFRDVVRAHPAVMAAIESIRRGGRETVAPNIKPSCFSGHCLCGFARNMLAPALFPVPRYAIYSRTDGIVDWRSCIEDDPQLNSEVCSTHIGMAFHPDVYRVIAARLAE